MNSRLGAERAGKEGSLCPGLATSLTGVRKLIQYEVGRGGGRNVSVCKVRLSLGERTQEF